MTPQQIKDNAPKGATPYNPNGVKAIYYKIQDGKYRFYCSQYDLWYGSACFLDDENIKPL